MPFNSAYDISLLCTHFNNKAALYNDSIFQALCLNQIACNIFEDVTCYVISLKMFLLLFFENMNDCNFLCIQKTNPSCLLCFELVSFTRKYMYNYLSPFFLSCFLEPKQSTLLHKAVNEKNGISWKRFCLLLIIDVCFQTKIHSGRLTALEMFETYFHNLN